MFRHLLALELSVFVLGPGSGWAWADDRGPGDGIPSAVAGHGAERGHEIADRGDHHPGNRGEGRGPFVGRPYRHPPGHRHWYPPGHVYPPYPYPYPYAYPYPYYPPPLYIPAEELYGPGPVLRMMGVDHWFRPRPNVNVFVVPKKEGPAAGAGGGAAAAAQQAAPGDDGPGAPKAPADAEARQAALLASAWKLIGAGDTLFEAQRYVDANTRYRRAARAAPTLAEPYLRQGFALVALGSYDAAAGAFQRGLRIDPAWPGSDFTLAELYGDNALAKSGQLDALAKASEDDPKSADLLFLVGVLLHFDGQPDRARPFFQRAAQLAGENDGHIRAFLR